VTRYVSLLRGVNLGPTTQVSMPALKQVYLDLGFDDVETYIRSGNVVFSADGPPGRVRRRIEAGIAERLGITIDVVVRTHDEIAGVLARNPFPQADPKHLHVVFLAEPAPAELTARLAGQDFGSDEYSADGREVYLHLPNGFGRSKLATRMSALRSPVVGSVRSWRTVNKLSDLSG
jgi:uncharacterized protein (DUF1697 family)